MGSCASAASTTVPMLSITLSIVSILLLVPDSTLADTPANCTYEDVEGTWIFYESEKNGDNTIDCANLNPNKEPFRPVDKVKVELKYPNVAVDQFGNIGTWTMIYNQGFEVTVTGRTYFAFSAYKEDGDRVVSFCHRTHQGWSHDVTVRNWACFTGRKVQEEGTRIKYHHNSQQSFMSPVSGSGSMYKQYQQDVDDINSKQSSWTATLYPDLQGKSIKDIINMRGGRRSVLHTKPQHRGNVNGVNYVSDVRNQGGCGSCYAFSSMGMLESRVNILTNNTKKFVFSTQDVVSCSPLSQGCEGGFPYLVAGRYAKDYGVVEEGCNPYIG